MVEGPTGSTVPRRQLGRYLRDLRGKARLTVRAAASALEWSEAKIWRIETGQTSMRSLDVDQMCRIYGAPEDMTHALMALAKETKGKGWWHSYGDVIPEWFDLYIGLEESAETLSWYSSELVPGLLQTPDYARVLIQNHDQDASEDEVERRVQVRSARQTLLTRRTAAPTVKVALNEAVVRRPVGGRRVMSGQLSRLAEINDLPNVDVRIVPFSAGFHGGVLSGPFVMMEFPSNGDGRNNEPTTVYKESFTGALYLDKPAEIERYDSAFRGIWTTALDTQGSTALLRHMAKEIEQ